MTNKKIITISLSIAIVHVILTSVIGHYISFHVGSQIGRIVASGLIEAYEKKTDDAEEEAKRIGQNMKTKSEEINERWKIPELIISLPVKPLLNPLLKEIRQDQMNKVIAKEISREQFRSQVIIVHYTANFLNSLSLGLLVFIVLKILNQNRAKITRGST